MRLRLDHNKLVEVAYRLPLKEKVAMKESIGDRHLEESLIFQCC